MEWDYKTYGRWLRRARVSTLPGDSQEDLAELVGTTQARISRWEQERPSSEPPSLDQCLILSDHFEVDFIELAKLCGQWNDKIQERVLVALASTDEARHAPVAQLDRAAALAKAA